jgi:hypothetical protein
MMEGGLTHRQYSQRWRDRMKKDRDVFKRTLDIVTIVIIAGGLLLAIDQAREIRKSLDAANESTNFSTWNSVAQQWLDMDGIFVEHPELRKYIFDGADAPTEQKEFEQANAVAHKVLDFIDNAITIQAYTRGKSKDFNTIFNQSGWDDYFENIFSKSPMICDIIKKHKGSYDPTTVSQAQSKCMNW